MVKYNYKVYFEINGDNNYRYVMAFAIEAKNTKEARAKGGERWESQKAQRERLKSATVIKTTCRKQETTPRARKTTPINRALTVLNAYILEDLSK